MRLLIFGFGFTGEALARQAMVDGWTVSATFRRTEDALRIAGLGVEPVSLTDQAAFDQVVADAHAILVTAPPDQGGCPGLAAIAPAIARANAFPDWIGYLSTTGVYGDREGRWVTETSTLAAQSIEGARRAAAERDWRQMGRGMGLTVTTFRLPGIYGLGRSPFDRVRDGAKRIIKPGHVFSRVHVDDIATALTASIAKPRPGAAYNVCDDEPAPGDVVLAYAAELIGAPPPPVADEIPPRSLRFYAENKRVANALAKAELGWRPRYPTYREGLAAILASETASSTV